MKKLFVFSSRVTASDDSFILEHLEHIKDQGHKVVILSFFEEEKEERVHASILKNAERYLEEITEAIYLSGEEKQEPAILFSKNEEFSLPIIIVGYQSGTHLRYLIHSLAVLSQHSDSFVVENGEVQNYSLRPESFETSSPDWNLSNLAILYRKEWQEKYKMLINEENRVKAKLKVQRIGSKPNLRYKKSTNNKN